MHKAPYVFPIVGGRKVDHLQGNIDALGVKLSSEEIDEINSAEPFDFGFPMNFLFGYGGKQVKTGMGPSDIQLLTSNTRLETVQRAQVSRTSRSKYESVMLIVRIANSTKTRRGEVWRVMLVLPARQRVSVNAQ